MWLVRDATGETDRVAAGGRAMLVLDVRGGERSSEIGMQHLRLVSSAATLHPMPTRSPPDRSFGVSACAHWSSNQHANLSVAVLTPPGGGTRRRISGTGGVSIVVNRNAILRS